MLLLTPQSSASAMKIEVVKSPGGIEAWLVHEPSLPLIAMQFSFRGGSAQDPAGQEGVANFLSAMLDEGAGDLDAQAFQERLEELAVRMNFSSSRDTFSGSLETLSEYGDQAFDLLRLALTEPRFDADAVERIRQSLQSRLAFSLRNPETVAGRAWSAAAFPGHPYGRPSTGTAETLAAITGDDLRAYRERVFARGNLQVAVVGDIDADNLGRVLDTVFGGLAATPMLTPVPPIEPVAGGLQKVIEMPLPQSVAIFGLQGIARNDADFMPAFVMNHALGGGGFASRLMEEVREKRGLAYSVYSYLQPLDSAAIFAGGVATQNDRIAESLSIIRGELERMAREGLTEEELKNSQQYLMGSYALRFDTNAKIAQQLLGIQNDGYGIDYVKRRNELVAAVTTADIKRVAQRMLDIQDLIVTIVGQPQGLPG
ncbi:MAG: M16 family metallopeptidase [Hyphomicrobiaceae bacterium]